MMNVLLSVVCGLGLATTAASPEATQGVIGAVHVSGSSFQRQIRLEADGKRLALAGDIVAELGRLHSFKVEVLGVVEGDKLTATGYRILDIGGGSKPVVGVLTQEGTSLTLVANLEETGGIKLNLPPRSKRRLANKTGAKIWVFGKTLVSGEYKVLRYGILKEPPKAAPANP